MLRGQGDTVEAVLGCDDPGVHNLFDYFSAPDDGVAVTAMETGPKAVGLPTVLAKRVDPYQHMGSLESLLTGVAYDEVVTQDRFSNPLGDSEVEGEWLITLTDVLRDTLAAATPEMLVEVALPWAHDEELARTVEPADLSSFLTRLTDMARAAHAHSHRLYCLITRTDAARWNLRPGTA
jgi:hypothetical protein